MFLFSVVDNEFYLSLMFDVFNMSAYDFGYYLLI